MRPAFLAVGLGFSNLGLGLYNTFKSDNSFKAISKDTKGLDEFDSKIGKILIKNLMEFNLLENT
jgi:hypothetical protein